jgi:hypothetical protein
MPTVKRSSYLLIAPALLIAGALLNACGSSSPTSPAPATSTGTGNGTASTAKAACSLFTQAEAETFFSGKPVDTPKQSSALAINDGCTYSTITNSINILGLDVVAGPQGQALLADATRRGITMTLSGVGDEAHAEADGRALVARKGSVVVLLTLVGSDELDAASRTEKLAGVATTVLSRA